MNIYRSPRGVSARLGRLYIGGARQLRPATTGIFYSFREPDTWYIDVQGFGLRLLIIGPKNDKRKGTP